MRELIVFCGDEMDKKTVVVALGGNAITREYEEGNIAQQFQNTRQSLKSVVELIQKGNRVVITHGNGPQVGNALIRVEESRHVAPALPLGVIVADLEGGMGYMIEQCLQNKLNERHIIKSVITDVSGKNVPTSAKSGVGATLSALSGVPTIGPVLGLAGDTIDKTDLLDKINKNAKVFEKFAKERDGIVKENGKTQFSFKIPKNNPWWIGGHGHTYFTYEWIEEIQTKLGDIGWKKK